MDTCPDGADSLSHRAVSAGRRTSGPRNSRFGAAVCGGRPVWFVLVRPPGCLGAPVRTVPHSDAGWRYAGAAPWDKYGWNIRRKWLPVPDFGPCARGGIAASKSLQAFGAYFWYRRNTEKLVGRDAASRPRQRAFCAGVGELLCFKRTGTTISRASFRTARTSARPVGAYRCIGTPDGGPAKSDSFPPGFVCAAATASSGRHSKASESAVRTDENVWTGCGGFHTGGKCPPPASHSHTDGMDKANRTGEGCLCSLFVCFRSASRMGSGVCAKREPPPSVCRRAALQRGRRKRGDAKPASRDRIQCESGGASPIEQYDRNAAL